MTGPDQWSVTLAIGVGAIKGTYAGRLAITEKPAARTLMNQFFECLRQRAELLVQSGSTQGKAVS